MLSKLYKNAPKQVLTVPEWLIGCFKREYILDSDGTMDEYCNGTKVVYMQTQSKYIDFRIPSSITSSFDLFLNKSQTLNNPFSNYTQHLFDLLCTQLCDSGVCNVEYKHVLNDDIKVSDIVRQGHNIIIDLGQLEQNKNVSDCFMFPIAEWSADTNYQLSTNYPEPGILTQHESRLDCFYEQAPSNQYLELWQYQNDCNGPCIYLELLQEIDIKNEDDIYRTNGRMIIMGNHFMITRDRKSTCSNIKQLVEKFGVDLELLENESNINDLKSIVKYMDNMEFCKEILDVEYSYGTIKNGYNDCITNELFFKEIDSMIFEIELSSIPFYVGREIKLFDDGNWRIESDQILSEIDHAMEVKRYWQLKHFGINNKNKVFT